jgi:hypothetical protein
VRERRCLKNPRDTVKKNPLKQLFSTETGEEKRGYPSSQSVGYNNTFAKTA